MITVPAPTTTTVAARLARIVTTVTRGPLPVRLRAWDGSEAGFRTGYLDVCQLALARVR